MNKENVETKMKKSRKIIISVLILVLIIGFILFYLYNYTCFFDDLFAQKNDEYTLEMNYSAEMEIIEEYQQYTNITMDKRWELFKSESKSLDKNYLLEEDFLTKKYIAITLSNTGSSSHNITAYEIINEKLILTIEYNENSCGNWSPASTNILIPINQDVIVKSLSLKTNINYTKRECNSIMIAKPILYLYPESTMNISIKLQNESLLKTTYPKYVNGWNVIVEKDGTITDQNNNKYYALYWDEKNQNTIDFEEGFYVTKDNAIEFLETTLTKIGLNYKEKNEFIMYWLPILEQNEQSIVYYELTEEREQNNKLLIEPIPDSLLRIVIHIKKVNQATPIKEQELDTFERNGFVAVEWGGIKYD